MTVRGRVFGPATAAGAATPAPSVGAPVGAPAGSTRVPKRRRAALSLADLPCLHRGEPIDRGDCPACSGTVTVAIYECGLHARCTLDRAFPGAKVCAGCGDRRPPLVALEGSLP